MLPNKISATNIETLIRNPYGFKAKNLLHLRKLDNVFDDKLLSKFGNFIHQIIEEYTIKYDADLEDKHKFILEIGHQIIDKHFSGDNQVNLFWPKFEAIARDFIDFDEERRIDIIATHPEIYGDIKIHLKNQEITITAIADRIDVMKNGSIHILDYKTGSLPTKSDVESGISVQMIIEALIVSEGGFKGIAGFPEELIYVKIASTAPYISTQKIPIDRESLARHKEGLIKILSFYDEGGVYETNHSTKYSPTYDDYKHLARKE
jgi:ATP-dependent helicase/nuclease subunit B